MAIGSIVEVGRTQPRVADRNITALNQDGIYLTKEHVFQLRAQGHPDGRAQEIVDAHVRRLEALRRAGIAERVEEGIWRVPADLVSRGHAYDRQRTQGVEFKVHSELPIDEQVTTIGATWLDRQLMRQEASLGTAGFGATVKEALRAREEFLLEHGFAQRDQQGIRLPRNLLALLRERELEGVAKSLATDTGLGYRPLADGESARGVYRQMISTAGERFAMLEDGLGFRLVPWRPVLEHRLGHTMGVAMHGDQIIWSFGRQRGLSR